MPALSTYLPQRPVDPSEPRARLVSGAHTCRRSQPTAQVGVAASHAAREVLRAQDTPASERVTPVVPPDTPHTATAGNARTKAMKPHSHLRLKYLFMINLVQRFWICFFRGPQFLLFLLLFVPSYPRSRFAIYHIFRPSCPHFLCSDDP
jgi:hypothetical protein